MSMLGLIPRRAFYIDIFIFLSCSPSLFSRAHEDAVSQSLLLLVIRRRRFIFSACLFAYAADAAPRCCDAAAR